MIPIDIRDLALNLDTTIKQVVAGKGPAYVTRDGESEAVIIRHQAYAPRLHDFSVAVGGLTCHHCNPAWHINCDTTSLGVVLETANLHWRGQHRVRESK